MKLLAIKINDITQEPKFALLEKKQTQGRFTLGDWKSIKSHARGRKVIILLPSNKIVLSSIIIPSKNRKQLLQAIPYALEDTLADDIENLHFSVHQDTKSENNKSHVAIISRQVLSETLDLLKANGITPTYLLPEILAQKYETDTWSISNLSNEEKTFTSVRLGLYSGFVCNSNMLEMFVSEPLDIQKPNTIFSDTKIENLPAILKDIDHKFVDTQSIDYDSLVSALSLNLLTNFIRNNQNKSSIDWKVWRPAAVLGGALASIWMGIFFWQNNQLQSQSNQLKTRIEQVYKDTFPNGRIVDASVQMNSALSKLKSAAGQIIESPLPIISNMGPLLKEYKDLILSELRYTENQLSMTIESPNLTRIETFKKDAAEKRNLKVEIKDSTTTANKVKAVIIISPLPNKTANTTITAQNTQEDS